jgi:hypothetical protein
MARSRNIKPGFFTNEDLVELDFATRLLFAGLWTVADKSGRLQDRPKKIKIDVFPADNLDVDAMLQTLHVSGFIVRYEVNGSRYVQIKNWAKHQNPHHTEKASDIPEYNGALTVKEPEKQGESRNQDGGNPADSGFLIPDSGFPVTDSSLLIPDSLNQYRFDGPPAEAASRRKRARAKKEPAPSAETWTAYATAYAVRYRVEPVRNATVNGQLANFVSRIGSVEAPPVAAFYVRSNNARYVSSGHSVGMMLMDAEKLRTEWATGRQATATQAMLADKTQTNLNAFAGMIEEAQAEEQNAER